MVRVNLPRPVRIQDPLAPNRTDILVEGRGRFVGFALVEDVAGFGGVSVIGGRLPRRSGLGTFYFALAGLDNRSELVLPSGNYRLYLITDGQPVKVVFMLDGLEGSVRLQPMRAVDLDVEGPRPSLQVEGVKNVYGAGADGTLTSRGLLFDFLYVKHEGHANTQYQFCLYEGGARGPVPWTPACPALDDEPNVTVGDGVIGTGPFTTFFYGGGSPFEANTYGQGFAMESAAKITDVGYVGVWLSYSSAPR